MGDDDGDDDDGDVQLEGTNCHRNLTMLCPAGQGIAASPAGQGILLHISIG